MQNVRIGLIKHLTNSLKIIFVKTKFTPKIIIHLKKSGTASLSRSRIRKLSAYDHMTHVVKIDILTGHEEKVICILF